MNGAVGVLFLVAAVWYMYSGVNGFRPVKLALAILQKPDQASTTIRDAEAAASDSAGYSGGGSFGPADDAGSSSGSTNVDPSGSGLTGPKAYALNQLSKYGWSTSEFEPLDKLWTRESSWNYQAKNPSSGAYGIPQALPASKMATAGRDYLTNANTQIDWGLGYIKSRYGSPSKAWEHETAKGWY